MKKKNRLNFWQNCQLIPPVLLRLLAKSGQNKPRSDREISSASGLSEDRVFVLQHLTSWDQVTHWEQRKFQTGCGIDFCNGEHMDRVKSYLCRQGTKSPTWKYLRTSPDWRIKFEPLMRRYLQSPPNVQAHLPTGDKQQPKKG